MKEAESRSALRISFRYALLILICDILLDIALIRLLTETGNLTQMLVMKDTVFNIITALLLFFLLKRKLIELKHSEAARIESEEKYRSIYYNSPDGILLTAPDGSILAVNPAACQIFGRTEMEICQLGRDGLVDNRDPNLANALKIRSETGRFRSELTLIRNNGSLFPAEVTSAVFKDRDGSQKTSMIIRDITERKKIEEDLQKNEAHLRMLIEKMPAVLWTTDQRLIYTSLVGAGLSCLGIKPNQYVGLKVGASASKDNAAAIFLEHQHLLALQGKSTTYDIEWADRTYHCDLEPLRTQEGTITGCIGVALDVTDRVRVYQGLEQRVEERTREIQRRRQVAEGLSEIVAILNSNQPLEEILNFIVSQACHILQAESVALYLIQENNNSLQIQASAGSDAELQRQYCFAVGEGSVGEAFAKRQPVIIPDIQQEQVQGRQPWVTDQVKEFWQQAAQNYKAEAAVPILAQSALYGAIRLTYRDPKDLTADEIELASALGDQAALAIENAHLRDQSEQLAVMNERNRLARELHDSLTQSIYSLTLMAEAGRRLIEIGDLENVKTYLLRLGQTAQQSLKEMRLLVYELRPNVLIREGLIGALQHRLDAVENRAGLETQLRINGSLQLPPNIEVELYRIAQEALNNTLKHSGASKVAISFQNSRGIFELEIADNGQGFDVTEKNVAGGLGLTSMQERAEKIGSKLLLVSSPGQGTSVKVMINKPIWSQESYP
ncbi:MAG: PAS domain S-box protein [Anaerolineae bacterium]|nr:PAS domain S-box protein [Anaerolineae bacterium]